MPCSDEKSPKLSESDPKGTQARVSKTCFGLPAAYVFKLLFPESQKWFPKASKVEPKEQKSRSWAPKWP